VRAPLDAAGGHRHLGKLFRFATVGGDEVDLRFVAALAEEGDMLTVGGPLGVGGNPAAYAARFAEAGQLLLGFAVGGEEPNVGGVVVLVDVVDCDIDGAPFAVGRDGRRADALDSPEVFDGHGPLGSGWWLG